MNYVQVSQLFLSKIVGLTLILEHEKKKIFTGFKTAYISKIGVLQFSIGV